MMILNIRFILFIFLIIFIASNASAFQKGENRILNSDFEKDIVGEKPDYWSFLSGG